MSAGSLRVRTAIGRANDVPSRKIPAFYALAGLLTVLILACSVWLFFKYEQKSSANRVQSEVASSENAELLEAEGPIYDTQVMPLAQSEAVALNAMRPTDIIGVVAAKPFTISAGSRSDSHYTSAHECLQQAIYYEAANESATGQRGVAQVVLNRVKHPAYPNSVCGVVYQGSERVSGCQFTFTCDGSLSRRPLQARYEQAGDIAEAALSGQVEPSVGTATHYHANYVLPYWSVSLDKVAVIGAHIFYAMRGTLGDRRAFTARYDLSGEFVRRRPVIEALTIQEFEEALPTYSDSAQIALEPLLLEDRKSSTPEVAQSAGQLRKRSQSTILADEQSGELRVSARAAR